MTEKTKKIIKKMTFEEQIENNTRRVFALLANQKAELHVLLEELKKQEDLEGMMNNPNDDNTCLLPYECERFTLFELWDFYNKIVQKPEFFKIFEARMKDDIEWFRPTFLSILWVMCEDNLWIIEAANKLKEEEFKQDRKSGAGEIRKKLDIR